MGQDKANIPFGNATLLEHVAGRLVGLCDEIIIAGARRPGQSFAGLDPIWVSDAPGATGPVAGLAAGLAIATHPYVVVAGCDMPFLNLDLFRRLSDLARLGGAAVPVSGGRAQPLHAVYSHKCLPVAESLLRTGSPSMHDLLALIDVQYLSEEQCAKLDPEGLSCFNLNTPADLRRARELWEGLSSGR